MAATASAVDQDEHGESEYDLTRRMMPYLDLHLIFPLLEFLSIKEMYPPRQLLQAKYDLVSQTSMTDYTSNLWQELHQGETGGPPAEFAQKREAILQRLGELETQSARVTKLLENPDIVSSLRQDKAQNVQFLKEHHGLTDEMVNVMYEYGRVQYDCGNYPGAADLLYHFRALSLDADKNSSATWGKFAAEILSTAWEDAMEELNLLRDQIDSRAFADGVQQLQHRAWLIHWSLFPFFNHEHGREALCDMFFAPAYINTIQTACPWILRYLAVAVVTTRSGIRTADGISASAYQRRIKDLVRVITQEAYEYADPVTRLVIALYSDFDFEEAQKQLAEAEQVLKADFFLVSTADEFVESAKQLMAEAYCRIHQRIDINELARRLNFTPDQVISLIHDDVVDLNAKVDVEQGTILVHRPAQSIYQQVIERTKGMTLSSQVLAQTISRVKLGAQDGQM